MVISIHPQNIGGDPGAIDSLSYRWLVTIPAAGGDEFFPPNTADPAGGRSDDGAYDLEFEFLRSPSRYSPPPADQIIAGGFLLPFCRSRDYRDKGLKAKMNKKPACSPDCVLARSLSVCSSFSSSNISSSRTSSASSVSFCSSDTPLKATRRRLGQFPPVSLPSPQPETQGSHKVTTLESLLHKLAQLVAAACKRAKALRYTAGCSASTKGSANVRRDRTLPSADSKVTKKGARSVDRFSSAFLLCRPDLDAAVESSIHEPIQYCKRSHETANSRSRNL